MSTELQEAISELERNSHPMYVAEFTGTKTRRERIATAAMQGLCANSEMSEFFAQIGGDTNGMIAGIAVNQADALIAALGAPCRWNSESVVGFAPTCTRPMAPTVQMAAAGLKRLRNWRTPRVESWWFARDVWRGAVAPPNQHPPRVPSVHLVFTP